MLFAGSPAANALTAKITSTRGYSATQGSAEPSERVTEAQGRDPLDQKRKIAKSPNFQATLRRRLGRTVGDSDHATRNRLGTELRGSFRLWRPSQHAERQLAQLQHDELQCSRRAGGHPSACDIGSAGSQGKLRQGRSKLHHALHVDRNKRDGNL